MTEDDHRALRRIKYYIDKRASELNRVLEERWDTKEKSEKSGEAAKIAENVEKIVRGHEEFVEGLEYLMKKGDWEGVGKYLKFHKFK